jgi:hypothetical protein
LLSISTILAATAGVIAFHIGLLTLVGRERKSPYVINLVFPVFLTALVAVGTGIAGGLVAGQAQDSLITAAGCLLVATIAISIVQVYRIAVRFVHFVDSLNPKHLTLIRNVRRRQALKRPQPLATFSALETPEGWSSKVVDTVRRGTKLVRSPAPPIDIRSIAIAEHQQGESTGLLSELGVLYLASGYTVQYAGVSRHPITFVETLRASVTDAKLRWQEVAPRIVVVDGFTRHFAFTDSIYLKCDAAVKASGVKLLRSRMTYAGLHSATSRAFNCLKAVKQESQYRLPTLVIYDGAYALTDLESPTQYRVFVRHVLPSEQLWGGMCTVVVECGQPLSAWQLLGSLAHVVATASPLKSADAGTDQQAMDTSE